MACLTAPFICLDGVNEKGVSIAVLTLPSDPTMHDTGKPKLATSLLFRLVLDRAATTDEALELILRAAAQRMISRVIRSGRLYLTIPMGLLR